MFGIIKLLLLNEEYVDSLVKLEAECFTNPWSTNMFLGDLKSGHTCYIGAFNENDELIGYIGMWKTGGVGEITNVAVHPNHRRRGIASSLIVKLCDFCTERDLLHINLEVRESNDNAILLYEKYGFEKVGLRKNYYKNPTENAILMTKTLLEERVD